MKRSTLIILGLIAIAVVLILVFFRLQMLCCASSDASPLTATAVYATDQAIAQALTGTQAQASNLALTSTADAFTDTPTSQPTTTPPFTTTPTEEPLDGATLETAMPVSVNLNAVNLSESGDNLLLDVQLTEHEQIAQVRVDVIGADNHVVAQSYEFNPDEPFSVSAAGLPEGEYSVQVSALDADGNVIAADTLQANIGEGGPESTEEPTGFPTALPTQMPTLSPTPQEIASALFVVRDVSGGVIGQGTLRIYAPQQITFPQTARVELELHVDTRYITPTPVPRDGQPSGETPTRTPSTERPSPTPREPIFEEGGLDVYQRMGASLICAEQSFSGCDSEQANPGDARLISINGTTWSWIVAPTEGIRGLQDLEVRVWKLISVDGGAPEAEIVWTHGFQINVQPIGQAGGGGINAVPILLGIALVLVLAFSAAFVLSRRKNPIAALPRNRPTVFISYGRKSTFADAWFVSQELQKAGADVFIDIEDIHEGRFAEIIEKAIRDRTYFVPVLAPDTLDSEWVRKEIAAAIQSQRKIVPVLVRGFTFDKPLPEDVRELQSYNAVTITPEFVKAGIEKLLSFIGLKG